MEQDAREGIQRLEEAACERGYREGLEKGENETEGTKEEARAFLANAIKERDESFKTFEPEIVSLIADTLNKLLTNEVKINPNVILHIIRKGFSENKMGGDIVIRVSDADYEAAYENREDILQYADAGARLEIIKDSSLAQADCIIETQFGMIDCSLEPQFEALKKNLYLISENR
jgi:flagellar assembly protein FliH